jgi:hypothetical protein
VIGINKVYQFDMTRMQEVVCDKGGSDSAEDLHLSV